MLKIGRTRSAKTNGQVTLREVAARAGVSIATVSRVLGGLDGVKAEVKGRVLAAVEELYYQPNQMARGLRLGQRKVIGVIIPDLQNPFFTRVVRGIEQELYTSGYTLQIGHSDGSVQREQEQVALLQGEGVAGMVFMPVGRSRATSEVFRKLRVPLVAVDRLPVGLGVEVDLVSANNRDGVRQATQHLLSLGYRRIAFINGPKGLNVTLERLGGHEDALRAADVPACEDLIIHSDFQQAGGYTTMLRFLEMAKPPRAVVVANNLMTLGALQAIHERGMRIPEDIAMICFDDMPWATSLWPPLTAVAQPAEEMGRTAAEMLLERLKDPARVTRQVVLPTKLVVRESCGALQHSRPRRAPMAKAPNAVEKSGVQSADLTSPETKGRTESAVSP